MSAVSLPTSQVQWHLTVGGGIQSLQLVKNAEVPKANPGEVLVRIRAVSLNYRDLLLARNEYPYPAQPKTVATSDGAGEVVAVGDGVSTFKVGDRVVAGFQPFWIAGDNRYGAAHSGSLGGMIPGMLQQYRTFRESSLVKLPSTLSFAEAATLPCAGVTAWNALIVGIHPLRSDHSVLVMGTGGVSISAAQIAKANGARVIATSSSDEKLARLVKLGLVAEGDTINYKKVTEWGKKAKALTGGVGVDHVIEVGGQGTIHQAIEAVRMDGEISIIGLVDGIQPEKAIDPMRVLTGNFTVRGLFVGPVALLNDLVQTYTQHPELKPIVDRVFPFAEAKEAFQYLESGAHFGKVVINVD